MSAGLFRGEENCCAWIFFYLSVLDETVVAALDAVAQNSFSADRILLLRHMLTYGDVC